MAGVPGAYGDYGPGGATPAGNYGGGQPLDPWAGLGYNESFVAWAKSKGYSVNDPALDTLYGEWLRTNSGLYPPAGGNGTPSEWARLALDQQRLAMDKANAANTQKLEEQRIQDTKDARTQTAQSQYVTDLMKQSETPEAFYRYLFGLYGEGGPAGGNAPTQLPISADQRAVTLNPLTGKPQGTPQPGVPSLAPPPSANVTYGPQGPQATLAPFLQRLFDQTGQPGTSTLSLGPQGQAGGYKGFGVPSMQTFGGFTPSEQANAAGYANTVKGTPLASGTTTSTTSDKGDLLSAIQAHGSQGTGLTNETAAGGLGPSRSETSNPAGTASQFFARGGVMRPPVGPGLMPPGGVGGVGPGLMPPGMMPPMPQGGVATQPTQGPAPGQAFGEAGPEAAVPLASPGGPLAMQALQQNQQAGMQPNMGQLGAPLPGPGAGTAPDLSQLLSPSEPPPNPVAMLNPTSRELGMYQTQSLLPDDDMPNRSTPGERGGHVVKLQRALERSGHLQLPPGISYGYHGPLTTAALARLQQNLGHNGTPGHLTPDLARLMRQNLTGGSSGPQGPNPLLRRGV